MSPLVSVIITAHNRQNYIADSIESVLTSSFHDFELIIVDDHSVDNTFSIVEQYKKDSRVKLFKNQRNLGQFPNRNYAASLATGKYIKYLDSDDMLYKYGLKTMVDAIESLTEAGAVISHDRLHEAKPYPILMTPVEAYKAFFLKGGFPNSGPSAAIINREAFNVVGGFPEPFYVGTDTIFWLKLSAKYPIVKVQPALNWYRKHEGQEINKGIQSNEYLEKNYAEFLKILNSNNCPLRDDDLKLAKERLKYRHVRNILNLAIKQKKTCIAYSILRKSGLGISDLAFALKTVKN